MEWEGGGLFVEEHFPQRPVQVSSTWPGEDSLGSSLVHSGPSLGSKGRAHSKEPVLLLSHREPVTFLGDLRGKKEGATGLAHGFRGRSGGASLLAEQ